MIINGIYGTGGRVGGIAWIWMGWDGMESKPKASTVVATTALQQRLRKWADTQASKQASDGVGRRGWEWPGFWSRLLVLDFGFLILGSGSWIYYFNERLPLERKTAAALDRYPLLFFSGHIIFSSLNTRRTRK